MENDSQTGRHAGSGPGKVRQIFLYSAPFAALAFFKIWASLGNAPVNLIAPAFAMLLWCVVVIIAAWLWDKPTYFDWAVCAYFVFVTLSLAVRPEIAGPIIRDYAVTGIYLCLFSAVLFPPLLGFEPFTYHYAKKQAPRAVWGTPIFLKINQVITFTWAGLFAICLVMSLNPLVITRAVLPIVLMVGIGLPFSLCFPDYYLKGLGLPTMAQMRNMPLSGTGNEDATRQGGAVRGQAAMSLVTREPDTSRGATQREAATKAPSPLKKETVMKVLAINSSPRASGTSKTGLMLDALVNGMREAGAEVETVPLRQKKIKHCLGCYACWTKTPGVCIQKDDMTDELFPKWLEADLVVYATPLYYFTVNATMKAFIERTLPALEPYLVHQNGVTTHPLRHDFPKAVVLSVAGFPEGQVFEQLSSYVNFLFKKGLVAEIYRPAAEAMTQRYTAEATRDILDATAQAGRELVESNKVSAPTLERITRPIGGGLDSMAKMANAFWKTCIQEGVTPAEFRKKNLVPRPDSIETFLMIMEAGFNGERATGVKGTLQFNFSGEVEGACCLEIENGRIEGKEGAASQPDLTVDTPFELWMDIMAGKADGQQMFMEQQYKASGDLSLLLRMKDLFGSSKD